MASQHIIGPVHLIDSPYHGERGVLGTYVIKGPESMLIDPGPAPAYPGVVEGLKELGIKELRYIALTHVHLDHGGGAWKLAEACHEADVLVHPKGIEHVIDPGRLVESAKVFFGDRFNLYGEIRGVPSMRVSEAKEGELVLGNVKIKVIYTPGHSTHSLSFWEPDNRLLIIGDSGGLYSKRTNMTYPASPPPFNAAKAVESIDKLIALRPEILCYSHFGHTYDAVKKLVFYREQVSLWDRVITQCVKEGMGLNATYDKLLEEDPVLRLAQQGQERSKAAFPNIIGFAEYAKWKIKDEAEKHSQPPR